MHTLPLRDTFHITLSSSICPFIHQSLPHNISEPIKSIYQSGYLRIKVFKSLSKLASGKKSPTCCFYTAQVNGPWFLCFLRDSPPHTRKAAEISACPLHTSQHLPPLHKNPLQLSSFPPSALCGPCSFAPLLHYLLPTLPNGLSSLSSYKLTSTTEEEKLSISCTPETTAEQSSLGNAQMSAQASITNCISGLRL